MTEQNIKEPKEIDLLDLFKYIWSFRKKILRYAVIGAVIGIIIAVSMPKEYEVLTLIAPETKAQTSSGMSGLAAMAGLNMGNMQNVAGITKEIYPEVIISTPFLFEMSQIPVETIDGKTKTNLYKYINDNIKLPWWSHIPRIPGYVMGLFSEEKQEKDSIDIFRPTGNQMKFASILKSRVKMEDDKKSGLLKITTKMQDPLVSALVADSVLSKLAVYMADYKTRKSREELKISLKMLEEAKQEYEKTQLEYAQAADRSQNIVTKTGQIRLERLENENTLAFSVYQQIASQVELAKVKLAEDTPIATIVEPVKVPLGESSPRKNIIIVGMAFLAAFVYIVIVTVKYLLKEDKE